MNESPLKKIASWYETLDPAKRKKLMVYGCGSGFLLLSGILVVATSDDGALNVLKQPRKVEYTLFNGKKPRDVSIEAISGRINMLTENVKEIQSTFQRQEQRIQDAVNDIKKQGDEFNKRTERMNLDTATMYEEIQKGGLKNQVPLPSVADKNGLKGKPGGTGYADQFPELAAQPGAVNPNNPGAVVPTGPKIRVITASGEGTGVTATTPTQVRKISEYVNIKASGKGAGDMFLPAGSIVSGTLVTGLDAPTSNQKRDDPFPVLIRIKHEAILPNRYKMDIRECFLIGSGYGDLSSERAYIRSERISCVKKDGGIIETAIDAYSVGEDGKVGIRGRLVSKNGQLIGNALLSGFVQGLSTAFAPQSISSLQTNVIPGQQQAFQYPSPQYIGGQALAGGVKGAATQIAQYYLEMAKNIFPIIEVDAGRKVDFVLVRGMELKVRSKGSSVNDQAVPGRMAALGGPHAGGMPAANRRGGGYGARQTGMADSYGEQGDDPNDGVTDFRYNP